MKFHLLCAGATAAALFIVAACSSDTLPGADDETINPSTGPFDASSTVPATDSGNGTDDGGGTTDAGGDAAPVDSGPPAQVDCTTSTQTGDIVQALGELGNLPSARGGTIPAGSYDLIAVNEYSGGSMVDGGDDGVTETVTDDYAQKTLMLAGNGVYHLIEATGHGGTVGTPTVSGGTYTTTSAGLVLTSTCPGGGSETIPYFFAGRNLYLYRTTPTSQQELYVTP